ncbi:MAG: MFS transporter [Dehalococcoidia bacterium]
MSAVGLFSGLLPSCNTLLGAFAPAGRQGAVFGLAASAQALAIAVGPVSGGLLASTFGIRTGFAVSGLLLLGLALVVSMVVRDPGSEDAGG